MTECVVAEALKYIEVMVLGERGNRTPRGGSSHLCH